MSLRAKGRRALAAAVRFMELRFEPPRLRQPNLIFELQPLERRILLNASPSISGDSTVAEGASYTLTLASNDSDGEGIAHWNINWGDGQSDQIDSDPSSATHTYADGPANYTIHASVTENTVDNGGGGYGDGYGDGYGGGTSGGGTFDSNDVGMSVQPYPPIVSLSAGGSPIAGIPFTLNIATSHDSNDPDTTNDAVQTLNVDWGDGNTSTYHASDYGGTFANPFPAQHTYSSGGSKTISVTASDDDTTSSPAVLTTTVTNNPPIPYITGGYQTGSGGTYTLTLQNLAVNSTIDSWIITWGDGGAPQTVSGNPSSVTHSFITPSISDMISAVAIQTGVSYASNRLPIVVRATSSVTDPPATNIVVNFQPSVSNGANILPGYVMDQGHAFSDQANWFLFNSDYCYGWDDNYSDGVLSSGSTDPRANTYIPMQANGVNRNWFIGLPNGSYQVHIVSGYNSFETGSRYQIDANGTQVLDGTPSTGNTWISGTATVSVTNGRMTISNGPNAAHNKIDYIEITPTAHLAQAPAAPSNLTAVAESNSIVNLNWTDNSDNDSGFKVYRSTDNGTTYSLAATLGMNVTNYADTGLTEGASYTYRVTATNSAGESANSNSVIAQTLRRFGGSLLEAPYGGTAWQMPGRVQAENFDTGGQGVGYSDEGPANVAGQYRDSGVDIGGAGPATPGWMVGWTYASGAYTKYTVNVLATDNYRLDVAVASDGPGGTFHVEVDDVNVTGAMTIPDTGGWLTFNVISSEGTQSPPSGIHLAQGTHVLKLVIDNPGSITGTVGNFDWLQLASMSNAAPIAPENLIGTPLASGQVQLKWQDITSNATGYIVQRSADGGITFVNLTPTLSSTATQFTDTGTNANSVYLYRIVATNAQGNSFPSNTITMLTGDSSSVALNAAADTFVDASSPNNTFGTSQTLKVRKVSDGTLDKHIYLRFDTSTVTGTIAGAKLRLYGLLNGAAQTGITLAAYGVPGATTTWSNSGSFSWNGAPSASGAALSTESASDDTAHWYEWDVGAFLTQQIAAGHPVVTFEIVATAASAADWQFNSSDTGAIGQPVLLVGRSSSTSTPSLTATGVSTSQINLSWTFNGNANGYYLERSTDGFTFTQIIDTTLTSYSDTGLTAGTKYWYRVRAHGNPYGESPYSSVASAGTTAPTPSNLSATAISGYQVNLSWTNGAGNQGGIDIERSTDNVNFTQIGTTTGSATIYQDSTASATTTYYYRIRAYGPGASSPYTGSVSVTTLSGPNPASGLTASVTTSTTLHTVHLAWTDNSNNETGFQIQRSSTSGTTGFTTLTTTAANATTYDDTTGSVGAVYWYRVVVVQNSAPGTASNVVKTALPLAVSLALTESSGFNGTIAYFTDSTGSTSDYSATINWADGQSSNAVISADPNNAGRMLITGSHTYGEERTYNVSVSMSHASDGTQDNTTITSTVADASLSATAATVSPSTGVPFTGTVATFTDTDSQAALAITPQWWIGRMVVGRRRRPSRRRPAAGSASSATTPGLRRAASASPSSSRIRAVPLQPSPERPAQVCRTPRGPARFRRGPTG